MNKKTRNYLVILIVLVALFVIIKSNDKTEVRVRFFDVDSSDVAKIVLTSAEDTLHLALEGDSWMIEQPVKYPAKEDKIKDLFSKVLTVEMSKTPLSISASSHEAFNVTDSLGTHVKIIDSNGKELVNAIVGRSDNYNYANARYANKNEVYQLQSSIVYNINPKLSIWRNKEILSIPQDQISKISVAYDEVNYSLTPADTVWIYENGKETLEIKPEQKILKAIISGFERFNASSFKDNEYEDYSEKFDKPALQLLIQTYDNDNITLTYVEDEESKYVVKKDNQTDHLFVVYKNLFDKFKKSKSDFME